MSQSDALPVGFRARLLRNTLYGAGGRVIGLAVAFFLTPYIVHRVGTEHYAIYALASILSGYLSLLDLGLGTGYVKYVAEAAAREDWAGVNEILASGLYAYFGFGAAMLGLWWLGHGAILALLAIDPGVAAEARLVFTVAVLILAMSGGAAAFRAVLYGLQRIDVATRIGLLLTPFRIASVVFVLESEWGILGLVLTDLTMFLIGTGLMAYAARSVFVGLDLRPGQASRPGLRRLWSYGVKLQVSRLSEMINFHFDKLLLARFVGLGSVTEYDLGSKLLSTTRAFPLMLVNALVPAISELDARDRSRAIDRLAGRTLRLLLLTATPLFVLLAVEAPRLVDLWLGPGYEGSALTVRVLALGYLLNVLTGSFTSVTQGIARNDYQLRMTLLALSLNVVLSTILVFKFGFVGVLVGTTSALVATYLYAEIGFRNLAREEFGSALADIGPRVYLAPALAAGAAAAATLLAHGLVGPVVGRPWLALHLLAGTSLFTGLYTGFGILLGGLDQTDVRLAREAIRAVWPRASAGSARL